MDLKTIIKQNITFIKFALVGAFITIFDLVLLFCFKEFIGINVYLAACMAFVIANLTSFVMNKFITFRDQSASVLRQYSKYLFTSIIGLLLTVSLMWLLLSQLHLFQFIGRYEYLLSKLVVSLFVMVWNFAASKFWTFAAHEFTGFDEIYTRQRQYPYDLSIIIPAYNEKNRIGETIDSIHEYIQQHNHNWELLVIDDGSTDDTHGYVSHKYGNYPYMRFIRNPENHGKGYSVKMGALNAQGEYVLFMDADNSTHISEIEKFRKYLDHRSIVIGSRYKHSAEQVIMEQPLYRRIISRIGNLLIELLLSLSIKDTQCGFKLFPAEVAKILFSLQRIHRFGFDFELLTLAKMAGVNVIEVPVNWYDSSESRLRPYRDSMKTFADLLRIKMLIISKAYFNSYTLLKRQMHEKTDSVSR